VQLPSPLGSDALRAWAYQRGPARYYQPAYRHIAAAVGIEEGTFLDLCCGPGWLAIHIAAGKPEVDAIGIDHSEAMLAYALRNRGPRLNVTFRHMEADAIIYPPGTFHAAAAVQAAHHWKNTAAILKEVHRVLVPGGKFYIYEADAEQSEVPEGWIHKQGIWPPAAWLKRNWSRYGMDVQAWDTLKGAVRASPFGGGEDGRHGFFRRMVLTRSDT